MRISAPHHPDHLAIQYPPLEIPLQFTLFSYFLSSIGLDWRVSTKSSSPLPLSILDKGCLPLRGHHFVSSPQDQSPVAGITSLGHRSSSPLSTWLPPSTRLPSSWLLSASAAAETSAASPAAATTLCCYCWRCSPWKALLLSTQN